MDDDQPPKAPTGASRYASGSNQAFTALGYLVSGMVVWGLIGWLIDRWQHLHGMATMAGILVGAAGGGVLMVRRFAVPPDEREEGSDTRR